MEMHGEDTNIDDEDNCFYLAPLEESLIDRDIKNVRDIEVLDPACGSGHMLFYAFDVLYEMYLEEGDVAEKYIPREILKNNLYGIDIDPGAAQLAALSLYVKAKTEEPDVEIEQINIVSADAVLVNGDKREEVLARADSEIERRVLEEVWTNFEHIREWGSLIRIEERIEEIIEEELEEVQATGQTKFTDDGLAKQSSVVSFSGEEESWEQIKDRLLLQVSELAEEALERNDPIDEMFVEEVEKSVRLLDLFVGDYDVVVTNPPYLDSRKMGENLKKFVKDNYTGSRELYTAFIERCGEFSGEDNYATLVTPENFMFLYSYRGLRSDLVQNKQFLEGAHLSGHSFDTGDRPFTIPFVLRNSDPSNFESSRFYRMTHEQEKYSNHEDKIRGLQQITKSWREEKNHADVYVVNQNTFKDIGRTPFLYWFGQEILRLFEEFPSIGDVGDVKAGLQTGDDDKFVRCWWEIDPEQIGEDYIWLFIGGSDNLYYDSPEKTVYWSDEGEELREFEDSNCRNTEFYKKRGAIYRDFSKYFTGRIHPEDHIFSNTSRFVHLDKKQNYEAVVGYLCSSLVRFIANGLNPSMHFQPGDGQRIPINLESNVLYKVGDLTQTAIATQKEKCKMIESKREFVPNKLTSEFDSYNYMRDLRSAEVLTLHGIIDKILFSDFEISQEVQSQVYENLPENLADHPHIVNVDGIDALEPQFQEEVPKKELSKDAYEQLINDIDDLKENELREISEELEVSPYTVAMVRHVHNLYTRDEKIEPAGRLLSYYLGCAMGRWNLEGLESNDDGIIVFDSDSDDNVMSYIRGCIELSYGEDELYERESEIEEMLNKSIDDWLRNTFFRYHHCKEYRRRGQRIPIYWQLESDEGAFSCFVYYHKMDADTFPKIRGQYIDNKLDTLRNRLEAIESELEAADGDQARDLRSEKEEIQADIDDISEFRDRVDALIEEGFEPDFEAGIWENIQKVDEHDLLAVPLDKL
jgi:hypothetical protein